MKWNSYGIIIFILSLVLTTTIEARGRGGGGRSSGGSRSSSSGSHSSSSGSHSSSSGGHSSSSGSHGSSSGSHSSSSGIHSSGSYSSGGHSSGSSIGDYSSHGKSSSGFNSNGHHENSPPSWNSIYGSSGSNSISSSSHSSPSETAHYRPSTHTNYNWDPSYQHKASRTSGDSGLNDFLHGYAAGNYLSHHRTPAYHYSNNWGSHTSFPDYKSEYPEYWPSDNNPPEPTGTKELLDLLNELNKPTEDIESMNTLYEKIAKLDITQGSYATPESTTTAMPTTDTTSTTEMLDFLNELNKPTITIESMNFLFKRIAKFDLGKALHTNIFDETTVAIASSDATTETTTTAMPTSVAETTSEATTDLPFDFESTTMEPNILNAKLTLIPPGNPSAVDIQKMILDTEISKLLDVNMSQSTLENGMICTPVIHEEKNEFGVNIIIEKHDCYLASEPVAPEE